MLTRLVRRLPLAAVLLVCASAPAGATAAAMPRIGVHGQRLYAGSVQWRAFGFNWCGGAYMPEMFYFDNPTPARLQGLATQLHTAHLMGANSMRIYLELGQVMQTPTQAKPATLAALQALLAVAQRENIYLDITGNLVWRPALSPAWYERLPERA